MDRHGTEFEELVSGLPAVTTPLSAEPSFARPETIPEFLSQLIAERDRLPPQRLRRRAPLSAALSAYGEGERRDVRRLPKGFFTSAEV